MEKRPPKAKKTKAKTESENFEDVARKLFKVPKSEIAQKGKQQPLAFSSASFGGMARGGMKVDTEGKKPESEGDSPGACDISVPNIDPSKRLVEFSLCTSVVPADSACVSGVEKLLLSIDIRNDLR